MQSPNPVFLNRWSAAYFMPALKCLLAPRLPQLETLFHIQLDNFAAIT
jgi:hypothetical protein